MLIRFDNGTPAPLRYALKGHVIVEAIERGWDRLVNGELIAVAGEAGFARFADDRQKHSIPRSRPTTKTLPYSTGLISERGPLDSLPAAELLSDA